MKVNKRILGSVIVVAVLFSSIGVGVALAQTEHNTGDQYTASIMVDEAQYEGMTEAEEAIALRELAMITADDAVTAAESAYHGAVATQVELDNENGAVVYSVELDNGVDVKVDAGNGGILRVSQDDD
ncbi:PepSY domain-containing protein [Chloroflexota bacterium]